MKNTVEKKLEDINNNSFDIAKITKDKSFLYFKNLSNGQDNDNSDVILNLYFIFRKGINEKINNTILNEIEKINSMIKEEIAKIDIKKKTNNKKKGNQKEEEKVVIPKVSNDSSLNAINSNNLIENDLCKVKYKELIKINQIKREENIYEENINFLRSFELETNEKIIEMSAEEFNSQLREINKSYEVSDNILIGKAINLFMYGEKGDILLPQKSFNNEASIKEQLNKLNQIEYNKKIEDLLKLINRSIDENYLITENMKKNILIYFEQCGEYFDIEKLFRENEVEIPLHPLKEINKINIIKGAYIKSEHLEEKFTILEICIYFCLMEWIKYLNIVKNNLERFNILEIMKKNEIKNEIIKIFINNMPKIEPRDLSSSVWNDIKRQKEFIKEEAGLNNKIKNYVEKKTLDEFSLELIDLIKQRIKDIDLGKK